MLEKNRARFYRIRVQLLLEAVGRMRRLFPDDCMTKQGIAIPSSIFRSPRTIRVNFQISRVFALLRRILSNNRTLARRLSEIEKSTFTWFRMGSDASQQIIEPSLGEPQPRIGVHTAGNRPSRRSTRRRSGTTISIGRPTTFVNEPPRRSTSGSRPGRIAYPPANRVGRDLRTTAAILERGCARIVTRVKATL